MGYNQEANDAECAALARALGSLSESGTTLQWITVRYIDHPTRPAEACLDRCEQMRGRRHQVVQVANGHRRHLRPATSRPGDI